MSRPSTPPRPCWPSPGPRPVAGSLAPGLLPAVPAPCLPSHDAGGSLRRCPDRARLHRALPRTAPLARASDARLAASSCRPSSPPRSVLRQGARLLRPRLTSRSGSTPSPFQAQGEISPGKNALLHCTTAGFTPLPLVTRASRFVARSPWSATPHIRFLSIGPQLRSTLPLHGRSPFRSCASLRSP